MNTKQLTINHKINQLKGLIHNMDVHQKYQLIDKFLHTYDDYFEYFEQSQTLSFAITHTKHSKTLTKIFLDHGYNPNKDPAILKAIELKKFKSAKIILNYGFNINQDFNDRCILAETLHLIDTDKSNTTLRKINNLLSSVNIMELSLENIERSKNALDMAEQKINAMYEEHPQLTVDIKDSFIEFKNKIELIEKQRRLDAILVEKSIHTVSSVKKI